MPALVMFRDWDLWYKPPRFSVGWHEYNKTGYVSDAGWVVYPFWRGLRKARFEANRKKEHTLVPLSFMSNLENIEVFFAQNRANADLFFQGLNALGRRDNTFFESPVRLPILQPVSRDEFEQRWEQLLLLVRPTDLIMVIDTSSFISRAIAAVDQGVWSHVGGYVGNGNIIEANLAGVVERPLTVYRSQRYRIGLYRVKSIIGNEDPLENAKQAESFVAFLRGQVGARYGYLKVLRLGVTKIFGLGWKRRSEHDISPNEMAIFLPLQLVFAI
jgi:hypothetical protein